MNSSKNHDNTFMLHLYNTLSRTIEPFKPLKEDTVKFYVCWPTVYNYAHIGNLCCYTFSDIVIRSMQFLGYSVHPLMNLTDIDDKTIRDSQKEGMSLKAFTEMYTRYFFEDLKKLNITTFNRFKPISELVPEMIEIIQKLIDKKHAYVSDDWSVYFNIKTSKHYGNLAHLDMKGMQAGAGERTKSDEYEKENVSDFALWKGYDSADGDNFWEARFQIQNTKDKRQNETVVLKGRPGWHIECSACNMWGHGEQIDIHMGGCDLIFPHHQNEIAQTEGVTGKTFSNYWMHTGHLLVDNKKMSKSAWNFYKLKDIEEKFPWKESLLFRGFRLMCLQNRYRENFNFTFERLESAMITIGNIDNFLKRLKSYNPHLHGKFRRDFRDYLQQSMQSFVSAIEDDIDTVHAVTYVFDLISEIHKAIDEKKLSDSEKNATIDILKSWDNVFGIIDWSLLEEEKIPEEILQLVEARTNAKQEKKFEEADEIRRKIDALGYKVMDSKDGVVIEKK